MAVRKRRNREMRSQGWVYSLPYSLKLDRFGKVFVSILETEMFSCFWKKKVGIGIFFPWLCLTSVMAGRISFCLGTLFSSFKSLCWNLIELNFNNFSSDSQSNFKTGKYFSVISGIINTKVLMRIGFIQIDGCEM